VVAALTPAAPAAARTTVTAERHDPGTGTPGNAAPRGETALRATPARATPAKATPTTVTLVTGDKVTVTDLGQGKRTVTVARPPGATGAVRTQTADGDITVVPDEALPYLRAGTLDRRLYDVSGLIRQGLADGKTDELPLIVTYDKGARAVTPRGAERTRTLASLRGAALAADKGRTFWRSFTGHGGLDKVWLDGRVKADMAESNAQIGTPAAWDAGLSGKGVTVAVLDTGVDASHPDLAGRIGATKSFVDGQEVADRNGHGTHVTSTVGGSGAASDGKEKGVAPGATLAVGKVLSDQGSGSESQIIAGMEWAARDVHARIVSMSLGSTEASDGTDPMAQAVNTLSRDTGALFVVAAGNTGAPSSIGSPGAADAALTVGAVDADDRAAYFTSAGPRYGDNALKPDLSAPGVDILAARSQLAPGSGYYTSMSGTSMATPHIAGVAALLAEEHPDWTGARLKDALMSTSKRLDESAYVLGRAGSASRTRSRRTSPPPEAPTSASTAGRTTRTSRSPGPSRTPTHPTRTSSCRSRCKAHPTESPPSPTPPSPSPRTAPRRRPSPETDRRLRSAPPAGRSWLPSPERRSPTPSSGWSRRRSGTRSPSTSRTGTARPPLPTSPCSGSPRATTPSPPTSATPAP
jgi:subtilisin family serine protease